MSVCSLVDMFAEIDDPRRVTKNKMYPLENVLTIGFCTIVSGGEFFTEMQAFGEAKRDFFETFLDLSNGIPSHDTFGRVFGAIDPVVLMQCLTSWLQGPDTDLEGQTVNIDGKAMRGAGGESMVHLVGAWATEKGLALGQIAVDGKSNEIEAIPHLIEILDLKGTVVTIDAAGCQKSIAARIIEKEAHYVLALKKNHPTLHEQVVDLFIMAEEEGNPKVRHVRRCETSHGREETRDYFIMPAPEDLYQRDQWKGLKSIGMVVRQWVDRKTGILTSDVRYYLTSLMPKVKRFAETSRGHWGIENSLHWVLDVAFREDMCRVINANAAANISAMNRLALSKLKANKTVKRGVATKRKVAGWDEDYLAEILGQEIDET